MVIVPEEAAVVRRIFAMYLCGMSILKIKSALEAEGITSPAGKSNWSKRTIDMILSNKKYCGSSIVKSSKAPYEIKTTMSWSSRLGCSNGCRQPKQNGPISRQARTEESFAEARNSHRRRRQRDDQLIPPSMGKL